MVRIMFQQKAGFTSWTPTEDLLLLEWQEKLGNAWSQIAQHIRGKSGQQCAQRWRHKVNPNITRDRWTEDEDACLVQLVQQLGYHWAEIARHLPGRTDQQCLGRWRRHLDPSVRRGNWSLAEDKQLLLLQHQNGNAWSTISLTMGGRTPQQCRARFVKIRSVGKVYDNHTPDCHENTPHDSSACLEEEQELEGILTTQQTESPPIDNPLASLLPVDEFAALSTPLPTRSATAVRTIARPRTTRFRPRLTAIVYPRRTPSPSVSAGPHSGSAASSPADVTVSKIPCSLQLQGDEPGLPSGGDFLTPKLPTGSELAMAVALLSREGVGGVPEEALIVSTPPHGFGGGDTQLSPASEGLLQLLCSPTSIALEDVLGSECTPPAAPSASQAAAAGLLSPSTSLVTGWSDISALSWSSWGEMGMGLFAADAAAANGSDAVRVEEITPSSRFVPLDCPSRSPPAGPDATPVTQGQAVPADLCFDAADQSVNVVAVEQGSSPSRPISPAMPDDGQGSSSKARCHGRNHSNDVADLPAAPTAPDAATPNSPCAQVATSCADTLSYTFKLPTKASPVMFAGAGEIGSHSLFVAALPAAPRPEVRDCCRSLLPDFGEASARKAAPDIALLATPCSSQVVRPAARTRGIASVDNNWAGALHVRSLSAAAVVLVDACELSQDSQQQAGQGRDADLDSNAPANTTQHQASAPARDWDAGVQTTATHPSLATGAGGHALPVVRYLSADLGTTVQEAAPCLVKAAYLPRAQVVNPPTSARPLAHQRHWQRAARPQPPGILSLAAPTRKVHASCGNTAGKAPPQQGASVRLLAATGAIAAPSCLKGSDACEPRAIAASDKGGCGVAAYSSRSTLPFPPIAMRQVCELAKQALESAPAPIPDFQHARVDI